jgi:hypothetical protein
MMARRASADHSANGHRMPRSFVFRRVKTPQTPVGWVLALLMMLILVVPALVLMLVLITVHLVVGSIVQLLRPHSAPPLPSPRPDPTHGPQGDVIDGEVIQSKTYPLQPPEENSGP